MTNSTGPLFPPLKRPEHSYGLTATRCSLLLRVLRNSHLTVIDGPLKFASRLLVLRRSTRTLPAMLPAVWRPGPGDTGSALDTMGFRNSLDARLLPHRVLQRAGIEVIGRNFKLGDAPHAKEQTGESD